ncbi:MAG: A/G-specific adenine glycosylase [Acidimicrobiales bacterium]|jgi:A/G-specific adenine glycosylase
MNKEEREFVKTVWDFYESHGRRSLPWRKTKNPYKILISEIMLQQTQVERVLPKYSAFLKEFPTAQKLADSSLGDVLTQWQGLGYNRRAKMLHNCAKAVVASGNGKFPDTFIELQKLSGVGPYTAGAVMAFAYNTPVPIIETNIRSVFIHHFFNDKTDVTDAQLVRYIEPTLDSQNPREWYWALMDYGAHLKKTNGNPNSQSKHYTKQSKFQGSDRQIRGAIVKTLAKGGCPYNRALLLKSLNQFEDIRVDIQLEKLLQEGMVVKTKRSYHLPT